jgi:tripartite-type tricarboxylate transporter receptor subunit TctC
MSELVALSRTRPVTVGTSGIGGSLHLLIEALKRATGGNFEMVAYRGTGPTITDTMAGHIDVTIADTQAYVPLHQEGKLIILGVTTERRLELLPNVPTVQEDIPGLTMGNWIGVFAPARTPGEITERISAALVSYVARPDVQARFIASAVSPFTMPGPEAFQAFVGREYEHYGTLIREAGIVIRE